MLLGCGLKELKMTKKKTTWADDHQDVIEAKNNAYKELNLLKKITRFLCILKKP